MNGYFPRKSLPQSGNYIKLPAASIAADSLKGECGIAVFDSIED
jgi:hypothetical protein